VLRCFKHARAEINKEAGLTLPILICFISILALLIFKQDRANSAITQNIATQNQVDATVLSGARLEARLLETVGLVNRSQLFINQIWLTLEAVKEGSMLVTILTAGTSAIISSSVTEITRRLQPPIKKLSQSLASTNRRFIRTIPVLTTSEIARIGLKNNLTNIVSASPNPLYFRTDRVRHAEDAMFDFSGLLGTTWASIFLEKRNKIFTTHQKRSVPRVIRDLPSPLYLHRKSKDHQITLYAQPNRKNHTTEWWQGACASARPTSGLFETETSLKHHPLNLFLIPWTAELTPLTFPKKATSPYALVLKQIGHMNSLKSKTLPWLQGTQH